MREIKFRGKCVEEFHTHHEATETGQWIYGYLVDEKTITHRMSEETGGIGSGIITAHIEVDPETVGQFTGLHDKSGEEVFEGDIVKSDALEYLSEVRWLYSRYGLVNESKNPQPEFYFNRHTLKIMGNIHDNPELL